MSKDLKRSKFACIRCRRRKTRCSGDHPCQLCLSANAECLYARKARKVMVLDIDLERYQQQIEDLQREVALLKQGCKLVGLQDVSNGSGINTGVSMIVSEPLSLLGCASPEVICLQLRRWFECGEDLPVKTFSAEYEEHCYDELLTTINAPIEPNTVPLNYDLVVRLLENVIFFINMGYLVIDTETFKQKARLYFAGEDVGQIFTYKLLMVAALGQVYDVSDNLATAGKRTQVPGLEYFMMVITNLPSAINLLLMSDHKESAEIIELFSWVAMYLRILDKKSAAVIFTSNALQMAISLNLHKNDDMAGNKAWWSIFCLNRYFSTRIGKPLLLSIDQIQCPLPTDEALIHYIELGQICDRINRSLFDGKTEDTFHNNNYKLIASIMQDLIKWKDNVPERFKLKITSSQEILDDNDRIVYTLHLNYLHHVYLTCIPILLKFAFIQIKNYRQTKSIISIDSLLTKNWLNLIGKLINSCQLTIKIFMKLYKQNIVRTFGFTDLDYLFSTNLVFLIAMMLNINNIDFSFEEYLQWGLNFMNEMKNKGNLVAKGKLCKFMELVDDSKELLKDLGYESLLNTVQVKYGDSSSVSQLAMTPTRFFEDYQLNNDIIDCTFLTETDILFLDTISQ